MDRSELKYHLWVMTLAGLFLLSNPILWFKVLPESGYQITYIVAFSMTLALVLGLVVTVAVNQIAGRLVRGSLTIQIALLILTVYGIPLGIWGYRLLSRRASQEPAPEKS